MSETIKKKFEPQVGKNFTLKNEASDQQEVVIKLDAVEANEALNTNRQGCFSLLFEGPKEFCLPQAIYGLKSEQGDEEEVFLVPVGVSDSGHLYEAVYTYLKGDQ